MQCNKCGASAEAGDRFCPRCGNPMGTTCAQCGASLGDGDQFCVSCGTSLAGVAAAPPAEFSFGPVAVAPPAPPMAAAPVAPQWGPPAGDRWSPPPPPDWSPPPADREEGERPVPRRPALRYKGVTRRFFAAIVDGIVFMFIWNRLPFGKAMGSVDIDLAMLERPGYTEAAIGVLIVYALVQSFFVFFYFWLFEGLLSTTPGKALLGMKIVNAEGRGPGLGRAFTRNLLRIVDFLPLFYLVGAIVVAGSETKQRVGDRAAGTYVVAR